jgi:hypothetical protein
MIRLAPRAAKSASTAAPGKLLSRCTSNAYCLILAFQITFRNKIPAARDPAALVDSDFEVGRLEMKTMGPIIEIVEEIPAAVAAQRHNFAGVSH